MLSETLRRVPSALRSLACAHGAPIVVFACNRRSTRIGFRAFARQIPAHGGRVVAPPRPGGDDEWLRTYLRQQLGDGLHELLPVDGLGNEGLGRRHIPA
jgi:hypothetical protein